MIYDPEANIMCMHVSEGVIDNAREFGNFIIHFSKAGKPIIIEILDASSFVGQFDKIKKLSKLSAMPNTG
jgi:uncharacterized protein YuzE